VMLSLDVPIYVYSVFFFFFQAEDGIRDDLVTGVQTCALPIWLRSAATFELKWLVVPVIVTTSHFSSKVAAERSRRAQEGGAAMRTEERRVGKGRRVQGGAAEGEACEQRTGDGEERERAPSRV